MLALRADLTRAPALVHVRLNYTVYHTMVSQVYRMSRGYMSHTQCSELGLLAAAAASTAGPASAARLPAGVTRRP